jgi:catechol 2,3-dioxygenase-like lactoylglutathione lyase family enzyme
MIKAVKFVSIPVRDQEQALAFYTEKLGFQILTDQPFDAKQRWIELRIPGSETKVVLFTPPGHEDRIGTFSNVTFTTDDIDRTHQELTARRSNRGGSSRSSRTWMAINSCCRPSDLSERGKR